MNEEAQLLRSPKAGSTSASPLDSFPAVDLAFQFLRKGKREPFEFVERADVAIDGILRALFLTRHDHVPAVMELVRLAAALRDQLESPAAAELIVSAVMRSPEASRIIATHLRGSESKLTRVFTRFQGASTAKVAPTFGRAPPAGSVKLFSFLDPTLQPGVRQRRGSRTGSRTK